MSAHRHIIQRPILEVELHAQVEEGEFQDQLTALFWQKLLPHIEKICDELSPPGTLHRIERMEIDLGSVPIQQFEERVLQKFVEQFAEKLTQEIQVQASKSSFSPLRDGTIPPSNPSVPALQTRIDPQSDLELLAYFMETGLLPWWVESTQTGFLKETMFRWAEQNAAHLLPSLTRWLSLGPQRHRLLTQFDSPHLHHLLTNLFATESPQAQSLIEKIKQTPSPQSPSLRTQWWAWVMDRAVEYHQHRPRSAALTVFQEKWQQFQQAEFSDISLFDLPSDNIPRPLSRSQKTKTEASPSVPTPPQAKQQEERSLPKASQQKEKLSSKNPAKTDATEEKDTEKSIPFDPTSPVSAPNQPKWNAPIPAKHRLFQTNEIYVQNSGLVLLWPFWERMLEGLGFIENRAFISEAAQHQAVYVLQTVATGQMESPEFLLPLNKILCGIPADSPLLPPEPFSESELASCDQLLEAVIAQVEILHNTSVNGFRGSFLVREGVLKPSADRWQLHVKSEAYDVILARIPWPYNFVKLPWMEHMIHVTW